MTQQDQAQRITVGTGEAAREIAVLREDGAPGRCGILWLSGFKSDMAGTKAEEIAAFARTTGRAVTRLDYSGHGLSGGDFEDAKRGRSPSWWDRAVCPPRPITSRLDGPCAGPCRAAGFRATASEAYWWSPEP